MDLRLADRVALVTGGSKGIGRAIVLALLAEGARVVNVNRAGREGESIASEVGVDPARYFHVPGDLVERATCQLAVSEALRRFGGIDILINNAGVNDSVGLDAGPDAFLASLQRNLLPCYTLAHLCRPELSQRQGAIVNVGSKVSLTGQGGTSAYAAAKGAINGLTREWAVDLARDGVRVNTVIPAEVWTPLYEKWIRTLPDGQLTKSRLEQLIPLGRRFTTAEEIADTVVFLASPRSGHTTGQIIVVDGGYTHLDRKMTSGD